VPVVVSGTAFSDVAGSRQQSFLSHSSAPIADASAVILLRQAPPTI